MRFFSTLCLVFSFCIFLFSCSEDDERSIPDFSEGTSKLPTFSITVNDRNYRTSSRVNLGQNSEVNITVAASSTQNNIPELKTIGIERKGKSDLSGVIEFSDFFTSNVYIFNDTQTSLSISDSESKKLNLVATLGDSTTKDIGETIYNFTLTDAEDQVQDIELVFSVSTEMPLSVIRNGWIGQRFRSQPFFYNLNGLSDLSSAEIRYNGGSGAEMQNFFLIGTSPNRPAKRLSTSFNFAKATYQQLDSAIRASNDLYGNIISEGDMIGISYDQGASPGPRLDRLSVIRIDIFDPKRSCGEECYSKGVLEFSYRSTIQAPLK